MKDQQGFVLVTALIILIAVTGLAVTLVQTSTLDTKVSTYSEQKAQATFMSKGMAESAIRYEVNREADGQNAFTVVGTNSLPVPVSDVNTQVTIVSRLPDGALSSAGHTLCFERLASSRFKCNKVELRTTTQYGNANQQQVVVVTGVNQQVN